MSRNTKIGLLICLVAVAVIGMVFVPAIPQDPGYHDFADQRTIFGISNFWNVLTNLPYLLAGIYGMIMARRFSAKGGPAKSYIPFLVFFAATALVAFGSAWYHHAPSNEALVWDRLPMAIAFMAFFAIIIGEYLSADFGRRLLWPLVAGGILSVLYWGYTERIGQGDLRAYAVVQFLPVLLIPLIILMFRSRLLANAYIWAILGVYVTAKLAESLDGPIYALIGLSGHSIKHLSGAAGPLILAIALRNRKIGSEDVGSE